MLAQQPQSAPHAHATNTPDGRQPGRPDPQPGAQSTAPGEDGTASDWGLAPAKPGFSRENKFILAVLLVLVAVFSFVVFRNFQKKTDAGKGDTVAGKDGKPDAKGESSGKNSPKSGDAKGAGAIADADSPDLTADPFGKSGETDESTPPSQAGAVAGFETESEPGSDADLNAPSQLNAGGDEVPSEVVDQNIEGPGIPTATAGRGGRRPLHSQPEQVEQPLGQAPEMVDPSAQAAAFNTDSEPADENSLAQTGGTAGDLVAQTETFVPPNERPVGTAPRTGTQPRVGTVPPPLDPQDERLGGYREGQLTPTAANPRTAARQPAASSTSQFDPQREPLLANTGEYIVRPNDNYWRISRKVYGTARYFAALAKHNEASIPDPKHIKPGVKISTPPKEQLEQQYGNLLPVMAAPRPVGAVIDPPAATKPPGYFIEADGQPAYRVGPTDTLSSISQKTLGRSTRWDEIFELNRDRLAGADTLTVGAILRLPPDASQSRLVGRPVENR